MLTKRLGIVALTVMLAAGAAAAQTIWYVSKDKDKYEKTNYDKIQTAVNAAKAGDIIEILDTAVYAEQVTIDGRDKSPWPNVEGGKNSITIRYAGAGTTPFANYSARPTIRWRDTVNTSPKNSTEAEKEGELPGFVGNFETCGALRILRAKGVTIEGIAIDAGSPYPFGAGGVWCPKDGGNCSEFFHANAAITLAVTGRTTIRDCNISNGYFGINVKDRNTGGVYGNPNPADNDATVPLSGFGEVGGHLFEYNRIHDNAVAVLTESAWDLGSTVRYNLIYNNTRRIGMTGIPTGAQPDKQTGAAFLSHDHVLSPLAIYNNTLYNNTANFVGRWKTGGQHLIFNNIFSRSNPESNPSNYMCTDGIYPHRMHHSVFSGNRQMQVQAASGCTLDSIAPTGYYVNNTQIWGFSTLQGTQTQFCSQNQSALVFGTRVRTTEQYGERPAVAVPSANNVRWLQTDGWPSGTGTQLPVLFKSVTPSSPDFLVPKWDDASVRKFIRNGGWGDVGIRNPDGSTADLGARCSSNVRTPTVARIVPTNVVTLNAGTATANFNLRLESGAFTGPQIKFLRWVAPVPFSENSNSWGGGDQAIVDAGAIRNIPARPTVIVGPNGNVQFATGSTTVPDYGFFEIVIEGTGPNGTVTSDVGFLPYRQLDYEIVITVKNSAGATVTEVVAGDPYTVNFLPRKRPGASGQEFSGSLNEAGYGLLSEPPTWMRYVEGANKDQPLTGDKGVPSGTGRDYKVYFTQAGDETIKASGIWINPANPNAQQVFAGTLNIKVTPGAPDRVMFDNPMSKSKLGDGSAPVINVGLGLPVTVMVQDKFGNATNQAVPVAIKSLAPTVGDVAPATASTDRATGLATFTANVTNGEYRQEFTLVATYAATNSTDTAILRIGRIFDAVRVFYGDAGPDSNTTVDLDFVIDEYFGTWALVTAKAVVGDTVMTPRTQWIMVNPGTSPTSDGLEFVADSSVANPPRTNVFPLTAGIAKFYVGGRADYLSAIEDASIEVRCLLTSAVSDTDKTIGVGQRRNINFKKRSVSILGAEIYGDSAGRPTYLYVFYDAGGGTGLKGDIPVPDSVTVRWPARDDNPVVIKGAAVTVHGSDTLRVSLTGAALPTGFTSVVQGLIALHNPNGSIDEGFELADKIGLVVSSSSDIGKSSSGISPVVVEKLNDANPDTIRLTLSEQIDSDQRSKIKLFYSETGTGPGAALNVTGVTWLEGNTFWVVIAPSAGGPKAGGYIKIDAAGGLVDRAGNPVLDNNRWVRLILQEVAPSEVASWYTINSATGLRDYAYITFDKPVNISDWFTGGSFTIDRAAAPGGEAMSDYLSLTTDPNTLRIDLAKAYPASQRAITTNGVLPISMVFSPAQDEWGGLNVNAADSAKPVIAADVELKIGGIGADNIEEPDTLRVTYSEPMSMDIQGRELPQKPVTVVQWRNGERSTACQPTLRVASIETSGGTYTQFTYLVDGWEGCVSFPSGSDSVQINVSADPKVADQPGNVQNEPANKLQPLKIVPGATEWKVTVRNNPFRGGSDRPVEIELDPRAKGMTLKTTATFIVFDNTGSVVITHTEDFGDGVNGHTDNKVTWQWDGRNQKGRLAGTGVYLLRVVCSLDKIDDAGKRVGREKHIENKSIGLVRSKI